MNNKNKISLVIGGMCILLSCGIAIQVRTITGIGSTTGSNNTENTLRDAVLRTKEDYDNLYEDLDKAEKLLEQERNNATENNTELSELQEEIKTKNTQLGLTDVTGKGVIIELDDNHSVSANSIGLLTDPNSMIVHDSDILYVVNELKNAGAEAISVNDQRIVANTVIACDGSVIKINGVKVGAPFTIKAIGMPETLKNVYRTQGYLWNLKYYYLLEVDFQTSENITIPKYTGTYKFEYAQANN